MVAAGYSLYGSACMIMLTTGHGVNGFTLDPVRLLERKRINGHNFNLAGDWRVHSHAPERAHSEQGQDLLDQRRLQEVLERRRERVCQEAELPGNFNVFHVSLKKYF